MNYPNIKKAKLSHAKIADALGYRNVNSFRCTSSHKRIMKGIDKIIGLVNDGSKAKLEDATYFMKIVAKAYKLKENNEVIEFVNINDNK